mmetsp:Transcript_1731/g.3831  ORF Transcript_1731/g.3831 Transcript_1731/m.3831 type:complete len:837 (-) Transcript_1731:146-2656(-)
MGSCAVSSVMSEAAMEKIRAFMPGLKVPQHFDKVYKDECAFTFDTPFSENGLAVNLKTWLGVAVDMVDLDIVRNGSGGGIYLLQKFTRKLKEEPQGEAAPTIGILLEDKYEVIKAHSILVVDKDGTRTTVDLPQPDLPMIVQQVVDAIIAHQGAKSMDDTARYEQDQDVKESKYYKDLVQLPPTRKISPNPKDWKCEISGDTQNLWLNLSDGFIGGGRKFFDGSGGSNGALDHFNEEKAKGNFYPLVVKLGTITPNGADVFSYAPDEDDLVKDPLLSQHLVHWGIDIMKMEKTDKTMAEMEVDINLNYDWSKICESGEELVRLRGPGLVGLKNLGNSCYLNSTVQLLLALPEAVKRYRDEDLGIRSSSPPEVPLDMVSQVAKLTAALNGPRYAAPIKEGEDENDPRYEVAPAMFRNLIGRNHAEFSSGRQQDAGEFLLYFLEQLSRSERTALGTRLEVGEPFSNFFEFNVEERLEEVGGEKRVKYSQSRQNMLGLQIKLDDVENLEEISAWKAAHPEQPEPKKAKTEGENEEPKPIIPLQAAINRFAASEDGIPFRGGTVVKTTRLASMPRYLFVQLQRYYVDEKWCPNKLDCKIPMPDKLDLEFLRGKGKQDGEQEFPEEAEAPAASPAAAAPQADDVVVATLTSMGIPENGAKRAAIATQNAGAEAAMNWYFEHNEDPDINDPPAAAGAPATGGATEPAVDPETLMMLTSMGFSEAQVKGALKACGGSAERAADWLFAHMDDLDGALAAAAGGGGGGGGGSGSSSGVEDGKGLYTLVGFVSHIGRNTGSGHYVCHAKRGEGGAWVIFNDEKVAKSESPPLDLGYIYLYRRDDAR